MAHPESKTPSQGRLLGGLGPLYQNDIFVELQPKMFPAEDSHIGESGNPCHLGDLGIGRVREVKSCCQ